MTTRDHVDLVERALVRIRRDQQAGRLHRGAIAEGGGRAVPDRASVRYLDALDDDVDGLPISRVAAAIGVDRPRASRLTTQLLAAGLIERRPDPDDARYALVRLTGQGRALVDDVRRTRQRAVAEALRGFSTDEARTLADLLGRFVDAWPRDQV